MSGNLIISEYEVEGYGDPDMPVTIVRHTSPFYKGIKWGVKWRGRVLGKDGEWMFEPIPSSRTAPFYKKYRFDSVEEAHKTLLSSTDKEGPKVCQKRN